MAQQTSSDYLYRCLDIIEADENISEKTISIMFHQYAKLVTEEKMEKVNAAIKRGIKKCYLKQTTESNVELSIFAEIEKL